MTTIANPIQFDEWNGDNGYRWAARADEHDRVLAPVADALLGAAAPTVGMHVLDIGCGCGATTLIASEYLGKTGSATGIDLSEPMLSVARHRARTAGLRNTTFIDGDAQTHPFEPGTADLVISRFGTMSFSEPETAFRNIATALRPGARLCIATWQPLLANEWLIVPGAALLNHADLPANEPETPGMFAQSDPAIIDLILTAAGFVDIAVEGIELTFDCGPTIDDAVDQLANSGPGRRMLETITAGPRRDVALADVRAALADHIDPIDGVRLGAAIWLTSATKPRVPDAQQNL